ncbi:hypothetical protein Tco_0008020 [Tanacetum coccineum]
MTPAQALTAIQTMAAILKNGTTEQQARISEAVVARMDLLLWLDAKFAKDLTSTRIVPSMRKLNKLKRSDMENLDEQHLLTPSLGRFFARLSEGIGICFASGEKEEDSCLVINLSGKVVEYNLISKTLHEIYDIGSNQFDDNLDHDQLITPFVVDHNVYEFILSFASV